MRTRTAAAAAATIGLVTMLAGCGDARLKKLSEGISRDSVNVVMGTDTPHRAQAFFTDAKYWEVLMYARDDAAATEDSIAWRKLSPVVLADGKVAGWGWGYWDKEAERLKITVPGDD